MLKEFEDLPIEFQNDSVFRYYEILKNKKISLFVKRVFDIIVSAVMLIICIPCFATISAAIKMDSQGPILFKQERITRYGKVFRIYKFRTMINNAEQMGSQVTVDNDCRITKVGRFLRKYRFDEIPQLINILKGEMSFVGTRPEVQRYVSTYNDDMYATLILPAGVTSLASIYYKDEDRLLEKAENADDIYIDEILPEKMKYNLSYLLNFSFWNDIKLMFMTVFAVLFRNKSTDGEVNKHKEVQLNV